MFRNDLQLPILPPPASMEISDEEEKRARALHRRSLIFDCGAVVEETPAHIERVKVGGQAGVNHTVTHPHSDYETAMRDMTRCRRWIAENPQDLCLGLTVGDIERANADGREAIVFGPQNSEFLGTNPTNLEVFHAVGLRIMQLTYQRQNWVATGSGESVDAGLSQFGRTIVDGMDDLGIVVDLSHCGPVTSRQGIQRSRNPVIFSHAHALAVSRPNPKAKSDDLLRALADGGGVIGITALSTFNEDPERPGVRPGLQAFIRHVSYVAELIGIDHVGIGLDFDETNTPENYYADDERFPELVSGFSWEDKRICDLTHAGELMNVTRSLVAAGFTDEEIMKVLGSNFLRVFKAVWRS